MRELDADAAATPWRIAPAHSPEHLLAVGRAATLLELSRYTVEDHTHFVSEVWHDWERIHQAVFLGGTVYLLRHPTTRAWATVYWRTEPPLEPDPQPYDLNGIGWDDLDDAARRDVLTENTASVLTGRSVEEMLDRTIVRFGGNATGDWDTDAQIIAHGHRFAGKPMEHLPMATLYAILTADHPDVAAAQMLAGLGGYDALREAVEETTRQHASTVLMQEAVADLRDYLHQHHESRLHAGLKKPQYECWVCVFTSRYASDWEAGDAGFSVALHWDEKKQAPNEAFDQSLREWLPQASTFWIDETGMVYDHEEFSPVALISHMLASMDGSDTSLRESDDRGSIRPDPTGDALLDTFDAAVDAAMVAWTRHAATRVYLDADTDTHVEVCLWRDTEGHLAGISMEMREDDTDQEWVDADLHGRFRMVANFFDNYFYDDHEVEGLRAHAFGTLDDFGLGPEAHDPVAAFLAQHLPDEEPAH